MERNYKIYMHKNKINGKVYIGQTYTPLEIRFGKGGWKYHGCKLFWNAIQKYGWSNFECIILEEFVANADYANEREKYYITLYNSMNPNYGYNIQAGGHEQTRLSKRCYKYSMDGYYIEEYESLTEAERQNGVPHGHISECCRGVRKSAAGFQWSYEKTDYIGEYTPKKTRAIKVYEYSLDGEYIAEHDSALSAGLKYGAVNGAHITDCCKGKRKSTYNRQWRYEKFDRIDPLQTMRNKNIA